MSVKEVNIKCWNCSTEFTANYEVSPYTINHGFDSFGNRIKKTHKNLNLDIITVSIKCPNPNCNKINWINKEVVI